MATTQVFDIMCSEINIPDEQKTVEYSQYSQCDTLAPSKIAVLITVFGTKISFSS